MIEAVSMLVLFAALVLFPVWLAPRLWLVTAPLAILGFVAGAPVVGWSVAVVIALVGGDLIHRR